MNYKIKKILLILLVLFLCSILAACGKEKAPEFMWEYTIGMAKSDSEKIIKPETLYNRPVDEVELYYTENETLYYICYYFAEGTSRDSILDAVIDEFGTNTSYKSAVTNDMTGFYSTERYTWYYDEYDFYIELRYRKGQTISDSRREAVDLYIIDK